MKVYISYKELRSGGEDKYPDEPWVGYFASLEDVNCYVLKLRKTAKFPIRID